MNYCVADEEPRLDSRGYLYLRSYEKPFIRCLPVPLVEETKERITNATEQMKDNTSIFLRRV